MHKTLATYVFPLAVAVVLTLSGCAFLDGLFTPKTESGKSRAQEYYDQASPLIPTPWREVSLAALMAAQNLYLGGRKFQASRAKKKAAQPA